MTTIYLASVAQANVANALRSCNLLPQRNPGATRPELIGLRRVGPGWFPPRVAEGIAPT